MGKVDSPALKYPEEDLVAALSVALLLSLAGKCRTEESKVRWLTAVLLVLRAVCQPSKHDSSSLKI